MMHRGQWLRFVENGLRFRRIRCHQLEMKTCVRHEHSERPPIRRKSRAEDAALDHDCFATPGRSAAEALLSLRIAAEINGARIRRPERPEPRMHADTGARD